jgi:hypothetical protein
MKLGSDTKERLKQIVKNAVTMDPMISLRELQAVLLQKGIKIGNLNSLARIRKELTKDAIEEMDRTQVIKRYADMEERMRVLRTELFKIIYPDGKSGVYPSYSEQISAMKTLVESDIKLFRAGLDMGIYRKDMEKGKKHTKEEELAMRNKPLPPEAKEMIKRAMQNWGMIDEDGNPIFKQT